MISSGTITYHKKFGIDKIIFIKRYNNINYLILFDKKHKDFLENIKIPNKCIFIINEEESKFKLIWLDSLRNDIIWFSNDYEKNDNIINTYELKFKKLDITKYYKIEIKNKNINDNSFKEFLKLINYNYLMTYNSLEQAKTIINDYCFNAVLKGYNNIEFIINEEKNILKLTDINIHNYIKLDKDEDDYLIGYKEKNENKKENS